jgi:DnaD/phage-associated family protein
MTSPYWAKLWIEILDDPKVAGMQDWLFRRFIFFVLAAKEYDHDGLLQPVSDLAWRLRIENDACTEALEALSKVGVTRETADGWTLVNFVKRQEREYSDAPEAVRQRRYREKHHNEKSLQRNGDTSALLCSDSSSISSSDSLTEHNLFKLYESNIGIIPQGLVDELKDAETTYVWNWIERAFQIAIENNVRKWSYVHAILKRWETDGFDNGVSPGKNGKHAPKYDPDAIRARMREDLK